MTYHIRPIQKKDNTMIAKVIRSVLTELGVPKVGTAYEDSSLDCMFETYQKNASRYFVVEEQGLIIGGGGVSKLDNHEGDVCELQKMYFLPVARGRKIGTQLIDQCLRTAKEFGYKSCYLETMPYMKAAQKLYKKYGFQLLSGPMGDTGHYACGVHMLKALD